MKKGEPKSKVLFNLSKHERLAFNKRNWIIQEEVRPDVWESVTWFARLDGLLYNLWEREVKKKKPASLTELSKAISDSCEIIRPVANNLKKVYKELKNMSKENDNGV